MRHVRPCPNCGDVKHDYDEVDDNGCVNCYNTCDQCGAWAGVDGWGLCCGCRSALAAAPKDAP
jgi:hypothetical protein